MSEQNHGDCELCEALEKYTDALRAECERLRGEAEYWKMKAVHCAESLAQLHGKLAAT